MSQSLKELVDGLECHWRSEEVRDVSVSGIADDSRTVKPGDLFIARVGSQFNGDEFVDDAIRRGAVAVLTNVDSPAAHAPDGVAWLSCADPAIVTAHLAERFYGEPSRELQVAAITGTNGKSTVAHLIRGLVGSESSPCGLIGTIEIDDGRSQHDARLTTPGAIELSRTLRMMVDNGCDAVAIEASSHAIEQHRMAAVDVDVAVYTNLSGDHLDYHGDMDAYADAKAGLFKSLKAEARAIVNVDGSWHERIAGESPASTWMASLETANADLHAAELQLSLEGFSAIFQTPAGAIDVKSRLVGAHNVMNLLQAAGAALGMGRDIDAIRDRVSRLGSPRGRLESVQAPGTTPGESAPTVLIDYAHTDDALRSTLTALRSLMQEGSRLIVVFGCGGDRDRTKRPRMGGVVSSIADVAIITSDNPRTEDPASILADVRAGCSAESECRVIEEVDRALAVEIAVSEATPHDLVIIAGKGHETYQLLPDGRGGMVKRPMDDRRLAMDALASRADAERSSCS